MPAQLLEYASIFCLFQIAQIKHTNDCRQAHNQDLRAQFRQAVDKINT